MNPYLITAIRIFSIIPIVLIVALLMGKRHVGELPVFDFLIAITLGSVVGADIADPSIDHGPTILAIFLLALLQLIYSYLILRFHKFRRWTRFEPTIIIQNGIILKHNLRKIRYSLDQILELLRVQGVFNLSEIEYALVEPNGNVSVLRKSQHDSVTPQDLNISTSYRGLPHVLVYDGKANLESLGRVNLSLDWLKGELAKLGYNSIREVFYAELDTNGKLYVSPQRPDIAEQKRLH